MQRYFTFDTLVLDNSVCVDSPKEITGDCTSEQIEDTSVLEDRKDVPLATEAPLLKNDIDSLQSSTFPVTEESSTIEINIISDAKESEIEPTNMAVGSNNCNDIDATSTATASSLYAGQSMNYFHKPSGELLMVNIAINVCFPFIHDYFTI